jgi:hypothetical protein
MMHKKLGPLQAWQWLAIGVAVGLAGYLYKRHEGSTASADTTSADDAATPVADDGSGEGGGSDYGGDSGDDDTGSNAIDPTTGATYASELATAQAGDATTAAVTDANGDPLDSGLDELGQVATALSSLGLDITPADAATGSTTNVLNLPKAVTKEIHQIPNLTKQVQKLNKQLADKQNRAKSSKTHKTTNTGHRITTHGNGSKTASSNSHVAGQRSPAKTVRPPAHQKVTSKKKPVTKGKK